MEKKSNWEQNEWNLIHERRHRAFHTEPDENESSDRPKNLVGLSLSGGGIRSALYNDGFLQGLSHRGFLRYVDFLSSVSGGGYIAGHLIAQSPVPPNDSDKTQKGDRGPCFHDDDQGERWHLGKHPVTGKVDTKRLAGVGGYLSRPLEFLPAFLWSCFFSAAFYLGSIGIIATFAALLWRSLDDPTFRTLYANVLGIKMGDELLIAFIPFLLFFFIYVVAEALISAFRLFRGFQDRRIENIHNWLRRVSLLVLLLSFLTSIAIFLGNGTTNVHANSGGALFLNKYAQWLAVIAGTFQVLVLLGSERLFRSERQEAKSWQKHLQTSVSVGVTLFLIFAMVHWMGRDNISKYVNSRDASLVRGDVENWYVLDKVFKEYHKSNASSDSLKPFLTEAYAPDSAPSVVLPESKWNETLASRRLAMIAYFQSKVADNDDDDNVAATKIELQSWSLERRIWGACEAYRLAVLGVGVPKLSDDDKKVVLQNAKAYLKESVDPDFKENQPGLFARLITNNSTGSRNSETSLPLELSVDERLFLIVKYVEEVQDELVKKWNMHMGDPKFTRYLLQNPEMTSVEPSKFAISGTTKELLDSKVDELTSGERKSLLTHAYSLGMTKNLTDVKDLTLSERRDFTALNRSLLEGMFPSAIRPMAIPSTMVVAPLDQLARCSWLGFWLMVATIGALGGMFRYRIATVFQFYRRQLGANFLVRSDDPHKSVAATAVNDLRPTADGMPYPLLLAATMEPTTTNGSYQVNCKQFVFSPLYCGDLDDAANRIRSDQVALRQGNATSAISLGDAVTLSGAAVSPLMTNNRCLSILVDFFNTGLGKQVYRTSRGKSVAGENTASFAGVFAIALFAVTFAALIYAVTLNTLFAFLGLLLAAIIGTCLVFEMGSPHFLRLLAAPREIGTFANQKSLARSARSFYVADGGFCDYLGVTPLLRRRCELIVVSDAGANIGDGHLGTLARMCERAVAELGVRFLDLDHEAPIDFGRLEFNKKGEKTEEERLVHQPYLCMRVRYPEPEAAEGLLVYCQMAITKRDPIEIQHIRNRFPSFPDEPTVNQFYTDDQVAAYRALGYHISNRMCRELERWLFPKSADPADPAIPAVQENAGERRDKASPASSQMSKFTAYENALRHVPECAADEDSKNRSLPLFNVVQERILTGYRLACYEENSFSEDDIYSQAVWPMTEFAFPNFPSRVRELFLLNDDGTSDSAALPSTWMRLYEQSADVRSAYRKAVLEDINLMGIGVESFSAGLWREIRRVANQPACNHNSLFAAHLAAIATACQEVHRGRPHSTFQIGGRRKLIELCKKISTAVHNVTESSAADLRLRKTFDAVLAEITEFERSVFQGSEHATTISFVQCLALMMGRNVREGCDKPIPTSTITRARIAFGSIRNEPQVESRMVEARRELHIALRRSNMNQMVETLTRFWYLGYLDQDAEDQLAPNRPPSFSFPAFPKIVATLPSASGTRTAKRWLEEYSSSRELRKAIYHAVQRDIKHFELGSDCFSMELWNQIYETAKSTLNQPNRQALLAAHLATVAIASLQTTEENENAEVVPLSDEILRKLAGVCFFIAGKVYGGNAKDDDDELYGKLQAITSNLLALGDSPEMEWKPESLANFAYSISVLWGRVARDGRPFSDLHFDVVSARKAMDGPNKVLVSELTKLFEEQNKESIANELRHLWYISYLDKEDKVPLLAFMKKRQRRRVKPVKPTSSGTEQGTDTRLETPDPI